MGTCKDRTSEFRSIAEGLVKRTAVIVKPNNKKTILQNTISVNKLAAVIGRETAETAQKLKELTRLAKNRSPFGDPTEKIDEYTFSITQDITRLQQKIEHLETIVTGQSSPNKQISRHSSTIINSLNSSLLDTTKQFKTALELRTQNLKSQQERRERFSGNRSSAPTPVFQPSFDMFDDDGGFSQEGSEVIIPIPLMQTYDEDSLIMQRVDQVRDIEGQIRNVHSIFTKLAELVMIQGEKIRRIEDKMDETIEYSDQAHKSLLKAWDNISSDRRLILKVFAVVITFMLAWFLFFA